MAINNNNNRSSNTGSYNKNIRLALAMPVVYEYISDLKKGHYSAVVLF